MREEIYVKGAREHNLKNIDVRIPRNKLVVITGLSGSGKSSLAFDTIFAEGQRRYMESLSSYARQFLGLMDKPDVDYIDGLSPAISIDQKTTGHNPRSTVGTVTEIYDYIRLLYARIGIPHCPNCGKVIQQQSIDQIVDSITALPKGTKIQLLAPVIRGRKGEYVKLLDQIKKSGYVRVRIDGIMYDINEEIKLDKNKKHNIEIIVDRLVIKEGINKRLADSLESVFNIASGLALIDVIDGEELLYSLNYSCPDCDISIGEITPRMFSFNSPFGACSTCDGLGELVRIDENLVIPNKALSLVEGAIALNGFNLENPNSTSRSYFNVLAKHYNFSLDTPFGELPRKIQEIILYGTKGEKLKFEYETANSQGSYIASFDGVINIAERRYRETNKDSIKQYYESFMSSVTCPTCKGAKLKKESLSVKIGGLNVSELTSLSIKETIKFFKGLDLTKKEQLIAEQLLKEINARLKFLDNVGLDYLTLSRKAATLSGGESQRIRLATQIGSGLMGVLYILDEPSIGLHQKDNERLLNTLKNLRDLGNTLLVVEHDDETMREADYIIDMGPGAGENGGYVVAAGTYDEILKNDKSITGQYLSGKKKIEVPKSRRQPKNEYIQIKGAKHNNLKNINVDIPIGLFTCVTGVSGSGKSTLVNEILYKGIAQQFYKTKDKPGEHDEILGIEYIDKIVNIDQSPIGRTPRSNPATYTGVFDHIREIYAMTNEAKARGYNKGRFSFNVKGGRCESCKGDGIIKIEMHFLSDVYIPCDVCNGKRYNRETLEVKYKDKNISDVLDMTVFEAYELFKNIPKIERKLKTLIDVGLGYIKVGQPSTQLSGGEAQRVKLATELSRVNTGRTMYILDEPTTGLHVADVHKLINIIQKLVDNGNTVVVIEHNLDVIKTADYIIDLGPEGGNRGGEIVAAGSPEEVAQNDNSYTGKYLKWVLNDE